MLHIDYIKFVLDDLQQKRAAGKLPIELIEPSPGRLRDQCLLVLDKRPNRKDEPALEKFFGIADDQKARVKSIVNADLAKFKPLINFLNKPTIKTEPKNVELLAWLIDFPGRPFDSVKPYSVESGQTMTTEPIPEGGQPDAPGEDAEERSGPELVKEGPVATVPDERGRRTRRDRKKMIIPLVGVFMLLGLGIYLARSGKTFGQGPAGASGCVRWSGTRYQVVDCDLHFGDTPVVPLDSEKLLHFRKIERLDTISENALGSIWCVKYHGSYECYTESGYHPVDTNLKLKLLTDYILIRHVNPRMDSIKIAE